MIRASMDDQSRLGIALVTTGGLGFLKPAPGTWGSLPPVVLLVLLGLSGAGSTAVTAVMAATAVAFTAICVAFGDEAEARFGKKDPGQVVADETAGQAVALLGLPAAVLGSPLALLATAATAFFAFRLLDIIKPPPARQLQSIPGGWGIVIDDLAAGGMAWVLVQLVARFAL